jgi:acyl-CoA synthetase (AMP-forming)/AMP-acid ligase II
VVVDAGLGVRGIGAALKSAAPDVLIGIPRALAAARAMRWPGRRIVTGQAPASAVGALGAVTLDELRRTGQGRPLPSGPTPDAPAAVAFTSGSTGPAKGVRYRHHQLQAQRDALQQVYEIGPDDRLVAAFAPFALYGPAMGIASAVPAMDLTAPATLTASALGDAVEAVGATMVFASPAALANVVATAGDLDRRRRAALNDVRLVMSAGAPVSAELLRKVVAITPNAELHTPYGMTEALPVADITLDEIDAAGRGAGVCVGHPLPTVEVAILPIDELGRPGDTLVHDPDVVGEVCVRAPHVKDAYDRLWVTEHATARPQGWHRSGDVGHLDGEGRLWIEGRMAHLIVTADGPVTPVGLEHDAETVPGIRQAAAVGVGPVGAQQIVIVASPTAPLRRPAPAGEDLADAVRRATAADVAAVVLVPELPTDKRHNSKIERTRIAAWADHILAGGRMRRL